MFLWRKIVDLVERGVEDKKANAGEHFIGPDDDRPGERSYARRDNRDGYQNRIPRQSGPAGKRRSVPEAATAVDVRSPSCDRTQYQCGVTAPQARSESRTESNGLRKREKETREGLQHSRYGHDNNSLPDIHASELPS
jgi:hypothetical protein